MRKPSTQNDIVSIENVRNQNTSIFSDPDSVEAEIPGMTRTPPRKNKLPGMKTTDLKDPISTYHNDHKFPGVTQFQDKNQKLSNFLHANFLPHFSFLIFISIIFTSNLRLNIFVSNIF